MLLCFFGSKKYFMYFSPNSLSVFRRLRHKRGVLTFVLSHSKAEISDSHVQEETKYSSLCLDLPNSRVNFSQPFRGSSAFSSYHQIHSEIKL